MMALNICVAGWQVKEVASEHGWINVVGIAVR